MFDAIAGYDEDDPFSVSATMGRPPVAYRDALTEPGINGSRIGLVLNALGDNSDPGSAVVNRIVRKAVEDMQAAGAQVVEVEIPNLDEFLVDTSQYIACSRHDIDLYLKQHSALQELRVADIVKAGRYHRDLDLLEAVVDGPEKPEDDPEYTRRYVVREAFTRTILNVMAKNSLDALAFPTTRVPAPSNEAREDWTVLTFPTNTLIGSQSLMPSIAVPAGFTEEGVPVGIEILARPYDEATAFRLAAGYEKQSSHRRSPDFRTE